MSVEIIPNNLNSGEKFEDRSVFPSNSETKLDQSINKIIEKEGFIKYQINKNHIITNGGNFLGDLYEYDIKGETKKGNKELNIFVKSILENNQLSVISMEEVYKTEMFVYKELLKVFNELQDEAEIPLHDRYRMVKSYEETNNEAIIMENVARKGFFTGDRMDIVSIEFAELAIKELAKFHGLSYVLKEKRPQYFEKKIKSLKSPYQDREEFRNIADSIFKITLSYIDEDLRERVEKFSVDIADRYMADFDEAPASGCLCHHDYRPNNIMAKITNGVVSEVIPVDYQLVSYGCPVLDFFYFIICSTDQPFRKNHLTYLKDMYHKTLTKFLNYFDVDVNTVYSREQFEKDYEDKLEHGLMVSLITLPFILASEDDVPDMTKDDLATASFKVDKSFPKRIRGVIEDYIEWGVL